MGTIIGWKKTFRAGTLLCAAGELALAFAPNMAMFIWVGRVLVGFGASFLIPSVLGLIPLMYRGANRAVAFGCIGAASGLSAVLPFMLGVVMETGGMRVTFSLLAVYFLLVFAFSFELPPHRAGQGAPRVRRRGRRPCRDGAFPLPHRPVQHLVVGAFRGTAAAGPVPFTFFGISACAARSALGIVVLGVLVKIEAAWNRRTASRSCRARSSPPRRCAPASWRNAIAFSSWVRSRSSWRRTCSS